VGPPSSKTRLAAFLVYGSVATTGFVGGAYSAMGIPLSGASLFLSFAILTSVGYWLEQDRRRRGMDWGWDTEFFLYLAWLVIIPYYLTKTRGLGRALLVIVAFIATYVAGRFASRIFF